MGVQRKISAFQSRTRLWVGPLLLRGDGEMKERKRKNCPFLIIPETSSTYQLHSHNQSLSSLSLHTHTCTQTPTHACMHAQARTPFLSRHKVQNTHTATWNSKSSCPALSSGLHGHTSYTDTYR